MVNQYPQDIRRWILTKGGVAKMTIAQMWTLRAELLRRQRAGNQVESCQIAAQPAEAGDQAGLDRLDPSAEDDGNRRGCRLGRQRGRTVTGDEDGDLPAN